MSSQQTTFSLEYILSVSCALGAALMINMNQPTFSPVITYFIVPLLVAYVSLKIFSYIFPTMNRTGSNTSSYIMSGVYGNIDGMGYMEIFPPLFAVLLIVIILLYNSNLG